MRNKTTKLKKSNLSYNYLKFFNEDISWASIDADLLNTSWNVLLTDVKTDEMYKIDINICLEIFKKHVLPKKNLRKHQIPPRQKGFDALRELPAFCVCTRCVSFFYPPNCINAPEKMNLKEMHPAAFYFPCPYTNGISLRVIIKDYIITQTLINETALNLPL